MKITREQFEQSFRVFLRVPGLVCDNGALIFLGSQEGGSGYPVFFEVSPGENGQQETTTYPFYTTIKGVTLPLDHRGILGDLMESEQMPLKGRRPDEEYLRKLESQYQRLTSNFGTPLEVIARQDPGVQGITQPKWDIWMLWNIKHEKGYLSDIVKDALIGGH